MTRRGDGTKVSCETASIADVRLLTLSYEHGAVYNNQVHQPLSPFPMHSSRADSAVRDGRTRRDRTERHRTSSTHSVWNTGCSYFLPVRVSTTCMSWYLRLRSKYIHCLSAMLYSPYHACGMRTHLLSIELHTPLTSREDTRMASFARGRPSWVVIVCVCVCSAVKVM